MSFFTIDVGNLFSQWHPDIRKFTENLDKDCVLNSLKSTQESIFDTLKFKQLLNLTNTVKCQEILNRILKTKDDDSFLDLLKERDNLFPRNINRKYSVEEILLSVKENNYYPILFLELNKNYYIIDGRTRFYCCIFLNIPAKVRILKDSNLLETCKNK